MELRWQLECQKVCKLLPNTTLLTFFWFLPFIPFYKMYFKPSRKNTNFGFLPLPSMTIWLKNDHLNGWSLSELNRCQQSWTWNYILIVKHVNIIKLKLLAIDEIKCPVAPLHINWDSSGSLPSSQETHFIVLQTWSVGQSLPTLHVLSRPFKNE